MITLRPYQENALEAVLSAAMEERYLLLQAATGAGKCLGRGTKVLMFDGQLKNVEDIAVGEKLIGPDSQERVVVSLARGVEELFKVTPTKGDSYIVNKSHILSLVLSGVKSVSGNNPGEVVNISVEKYIEQTKTFKHCAKGWRVGVDFINKEFTDLPVPPYILGVWLGDGSNINTNGFANQDKEIVDSINDYADSIGLMVRHCIQDGKCPMHFITRGKKGATKNPFIQAIKSLGLPKNKHIPIAYKTASRFDRLQLLAGLIDTDGFLTNSCYDFISKHKALADDVAFLCRSLGLAAYVSRAMKKSQTMPENKEYWRVCISGDCDIVPCKVPRRISPPRTQKKDVLRVGLTVTPIGEGEYFGFEISGNDRLFLLGDFTVTHNTVVFSELIKRLMAQYHMRIGIVAHREILVRQAHEKLLNTWPEGCDLIGLACSSVSAKKNINAPVVIGSPQTLARRVADMETPLDMLIVDEAHRLPPRNAKSQYGSLISSLEARYNGLRVLGVTATPFRLGHGYIYGNKCRPTAENWFPSLHYTVSINDLTESGFLVPWCGKEAENIAGELSDISLAGGDYNLGQLENMMTKGVHIENAVRAVQDHASDRRHIVVFCTTISHAEKVAATFTAGGFAAACVHSEMDREEKARSMADFERGKIRVLTSVGMLTEGWDCTAVDCLVMCRPTKSPALYVQIIGRGLRLHPGKKDCMVLDLSNNCATHGDPNDPVVTVPGKKKKGTLEQMLKTCPECDELVSPGKRECPGCGYLFAPIEVVEDKTPLVFKDINVKGKSFLDFKPEEKVMKVEKWEMQPYTSKAGNEMVKLTMWCRNGSVIPIVVNHFLDFEGNASPYAQKKARKWLSDNYIDTSEDYDLDTAIHASAQPGYSAEFIQDFSPYILIPDEVTLINDGKYNKVKGW